MDKPTRISSKPSQKNSNIISKTIKNTMPNINTANLNTQRATFGKISKEAKQKFYAKKDMPITASMTPKASIIAVKQTKTTKEPFGPHGGGGRYGGRYGGRGGYSRPSRPSRPIVRNYYNSGYGGGWGGYGGWGLSYPYVYPVEVPVTVDTSETDKQQVKNEIKEELRRDMRPIRSGTMESQIIMVLIALVLGALLYKVFSK
jgi:hypothetical protein